mgnify:CR=1 FL=1
MNVEHGESFVTLEVDIITVKTQGAFNREGIIKAFDQLKLIIESNNLSSFKVLLDYSDSEGGTPAAYDEVNRCNLWLNTQNMTAKATVMTSPMYQSILESRTPASKTQNAKLFTDKQSAISWLKSQ